MERENTALYREVATHEETIEILQNRIHTMQTEHNRQLLEIQQMFLRIKFALVYQRLTISQCRGLPFIEPDKAAQALRN